MILLSQETIPHCLHRISACMKFSISNWRVIDPLQQIVPCKIYIIQRIIIEIINRILSTYLLILYFQSFCKQLEINLNNMIFAGI